MQKYSSLNANQEFDRSIIISNLKLSHLEYKKCGGKELVMSPSAQENQGTKQVLKIGMEGYGFGASKYYMQLKEELKKEVILYSAEYLVRMIKGLIRPYDFMVMDVLYHNCLTEETFAAQEFHICVQKQRKKKVSEIKTSNPYCLNSHLFSMHSDNTYLVTFKKLILSYEAFLLFYCVYNY